MDFKLKYFKYKKKYLALKTQLGGTDELSLECNKYNTFGTTMGPIHKKSTKYKAIECLNSKAGCKIEKVGTNIHNKQLICRSDQEKNKKIRLLDSYIKEYNKDTTRYSLNIDDGVKYYWKFHEFNFNHDNIDYLEIDDGFPIAHRDKNNKIYAIQLRKIIFKENEPKKLLGGCGNNPIFFPSNTKVNKELGPDNFMKRCIKEYIPAAWKMDKETAEIECNKVFKRDHTHKNFITLDPVWTNNPTIISFFGVYKLEFLEDGLFDEIYQEYIDLMSEPNFIIGDDIEGNDLVSSKSEIIRLTNGKQLLYFEPNPIKPWNIFFDRTSGKPYYFNSKTNEIKWWLSEGEGEKVVAFLEIDYLSGDISLDKDDYKFGIYLTYGFIKEKKEYLKRNSITKKFNFRDFEK